MNVTFVDADPRRQARPLLDNILTNGIDQIAIACAFLTGAGAEVLKPHAARLSKPSSFVVAAWEWPTSLEALTELHAVAPNNLYYHLGAQTPVEKAVGRGIMHSKAFFARAGRRCWLWTGSHNLTANAMLGVNREAAILLEGTDDEQPFQNAVKHLESCRDEAIPFDPNHPPPPLDPQPTLIIHAESHTTLQAPPWFVHFRPSTTLYDKLMRPPSPVWLFLYPPQSLTPARTRPIPQAAYSGTITALNFTEHHPTKGTPASWTQAPYIIEDQGGVFAVTQSRPATKTPTQGVFSIQAEEPASTLWLSENPAAKMEKTVSEERIEDLEPKFQRFFTTRSLRNGRLVIREYDDMKPAYRFPDKEIGMAGTAELAERLKMPRDARVDLRKSRRDDFLFVYRAKYKV